MSSSSSRYTQLNGQHIAGWDDPRRLGDASLAGGAPRSRRQPAGRQRCRLHLRLRAAAPAPAIAGTILIHPRIGPGTPRAGMVRWAATPTWSPGQQYNTETLDQALKDPYATELFADGHHGCRHRQPRRYGAREPGHQPDCPGGQQADQERQDPAGNQARAAPDLYPVEGPCRRRSDHRALPPPRALCSHRRAQDRPARPEPRRPRVRNHRRRQVQGPRDQHYRQRGIFGRTPPQGDVQHKEAGGLLGFAKSNDSYDPDRLLGRSAEVAPSI